MGGEGVEVVSAACSQSHLTPVVRDGVCSHLSGCRRMHVRETDDEKKKTGSMPCFFAGAWSGYMSFLHALLKTATVCHIGSTPGHFQVMMQVLMKDVLI